MPRVILKNEDKVMVVLVGLNVSRLFDDDDDDDDDDGQLLTEVLNERVTLLSYVLFVGSTVDEDTFVISDV